MSKIVKIVSLIVLAVALGYGSFGVFCVVYSFLVPQIASSAICCLLMAVSLRWIASQLVSTTWIRPGPDDMVRN